MLGGQLSLRVAVTQLSLPAIMLSGASKLVSTYFSLFYRSAHVLYTEICYIVKNELRKAM